MKNRLSRWMVLGALALGMFATEQGQAYFDGTEWGWPYPQSGGMLGQGDTYDWNGSSYNWGWALARYSGATQECFSWEKWRNANGGWDPERYAWDTPCGTYIVVEDYFDGASYDYGQCKMWGYAGAEGGCS